MSRTRNRIIGSVATALVVAATVAPGVGANERTATELGQSTDPSASVAPSNQSSERTATELGQSTNASPTPVEESTGVDWDAVAIVGGGVLGLVLIGLAGMVALTRRRGTVRKSRAPAVSS
ncbi:MAG: hypothetical protein ACRDMA_16605 [Solirubrobacterales bacterium]